MKSTPRLVLNGYVLENAFYHLGGYAQWTFAEKNGKQWFVKRFTDPLRPDLSGTLDHSYVEEWRNTFHLFFVEKLVLYATINSCDNGNIITIESVFCRENRCHVVTERVQVDETVKPQEVCRLSNAEKYLLLKVLTDCLAKLHRRHIVYADLRPDNVLLKRSLKGKLIPKLIDFDGSYFEDNQPPADRLPISEKYIAPETARVYFDGEKLPLTTKVDVFSLGLFFHLYWTGVLPWFDQSKYKFAFEAVMDGPGLEISPNVPEELASLIRKMLMNRPEARPTMDKVIWELNNITGDSGETEPDTGKSKPLIKIGNTMRSRASTPEKQPLSEDESEENLRHKIIGMLDYITRESKSDFPEEDVSSEIEEARKYIMNKKKADSAENATVHVITHKTEGTTSRDLSGKIADSFYDGFYPVTHIEKRHGLT